MKNVFLGLVAVPVTALATSVLIHTDKERAMAADRVAVVEVVSRRTVTDERDPRRFTTQTTLQIVENVRGTGPSTVTLIQLGGKRGDQLVQIAGDPEFAPNERAVVFLNCPNAPDRCYLVAMGEGKLPIVDVDRVVLHDMRTNERSRIALRTFIDVIKQLPPGKVKPGAAK